MKKFTHGIIFVDPTNIDDNDDVAIVHFIGLWGEPTEEQVTGYIEEVRNDPQFGVGELMNRLVVIEAPPEIVEIYNKMYEEHKQSKLN